MSAPASEPEPSTNTEPVATESYSQMVAAVEDVADAVREGAALSEDQLHRLRESTRHLRRAIEIRSITGSVPCRGCSEVFVRIDPEAEFCSEACRDTPAADRVVGR